MTTQTVSGRRYFTKAWLMEQKSLIALLVLIAIVSTLSPNFFTINNLFNILQQTSVNAIMAVGMTLVDDGNGVCADYAVKGDLHGFQQVYLIRFLQEINQLYQHFRIC